ncbi:MAG: PAS domain-containing protein [Candidatus Rokubacteria bacterium]|nr:PAS domain-containing protein [Candidatus Rokubacteria bacterium]
MEHLFERGLGPRNPGGGSEGGRALLRINYESVLSGLPDAVVGVDEALRIILWNGAAEALTGKSARRVQGRTLKEILAPDSSLVRHLSETLRSGESRSEAEATIEGGDGRPIPVSIVTAPIAGRTGTVETAVAVLRDLSRIRQLEAEVRRGETLAAAGRMAVGLAHEIRNPLSAIRGAVQLLRKELGDEARWGEYTEVLMKEVDRVNRIIELLLDLGRPVQLRPVPLNLHQLLERVALLSEEMAGSRGVRIVRRYDPSLPPILADEDRIVQVFHNLVRNAIDAMPRGGRLTLATRLSLNPLFTKVDLGSGMRQLVEVQVSDEGEGIPEALRAKIFDPFVSTKERGLGLGLALCHRIIEEHKGAIHIESVPGKGTSVSCFLPIAR